jgi:hypothetical protein
MGALVVPGVRTIVAVAAVLGVTFGATELGTVVAARQHHAPGATGVLLALWGAGSIVAGTVAATDAHLAEVADTPLVRGADAA